MYTCAASVPGTADVKICLKMLNHAIEVREGIQSNDIILYSIFMFTET